MQLQSWLRTRWWPFRRINGLKCHQKINTKPSFLYTKTGFLCSPDLDHDVDLPQNRIPDIGPMEKPGPKFRKSVTQNKNPMLCGLTFNKACQKCISTNTNCLRQQARKLCALVVEGKSKRSGRNCINGLYKYRTTVQQRFFAIKSLLLKRMSNLPFKMKKFTPKIYSMLNFFSLIYQCSYQFQHNVCSYQRSFLYT